jgi:divalent metal cation (Fe/Co/Zn/Cd) transporter
MLLTGDTNWLDSLVALVIALATTYQAVKLVRKVITDLREKRPAAVSAARRCG